MRAGLNEETVQEYLEAMMDSQAEGSHPKAYWPFPPVVVFYDGNVYWTGDGFHRVEAARRYVAQEKERQNPAPRLTIPADVRAGAGP
jgi:hypothetical protein